MGLIRDNRTLFRTRGALCLLSESLNEKGHPKVALFASTCVDYLRSFTGVNLRSL